MSKTYSRVLLVTANVGSIFEEPDKMIPVWMREFLAVLTRLEPEFLAIHCQEVGGKNYEDTMQHVNKFIKLLLSSEEMQQFTRACVFLDEDFTAVEKFTALGSLYFIHHTVQSVEIFDFHDAKFVPLKGKEVLSGNIEHVRIKEKAKFAQEFFPDFVWSRKGFIRTRWNLCGTVFDLVNIHLIHDVSNVAAMETSPSTYCDFRVKALLHTIGRFETDRYEKVPFFMFGDFNFRLDTHQLVKKLTQHTVEQRVLGKKNDVSKVIYKQPDNGKVILTVGKKDFHHHEHNELFSRTNAMALQVYDKEPEACHSKLFEYKVTFPPSYPFSEDAEDGTSYMPTRCPGWCDRIMMSYDAQKLFHMDNGFTSEYKMIGMHICMGDHKPIYLNLQLCHQSVTGNSLAAVAAQLTASTVDSDSVTLTRTHPPVRHVISVNGEEEDVDNINIHDFTTFEQEDLIGPRFIGSLKRKSADTADNSASTKGLRRSGLSSFRHAVRTVLSTEAVMRALKHYSHRSDSEDTEDDDELSRSVSHTNAQTGSANVAQTNNSTLSHNTTTLETCNQATVFSDSKTVAEPQLAQAVAKLEPNHCLAELAAVQAVDQLEPNHGVAKSEAVQAVAKLVTNHSVAKPQTSQAVAELETNHSVAEPEAAQNGAKREPSHCVSEPEAAQAVAELELCHSVAKPEAAQAVAKLEPSHSVAKPEVAQAVTLQPTHSVAKAEAAQAVAKLEPSHCVAKPEAAQVVAKLELCHSVAKPDAAQAVAKLQPTHSVAKAEAAQAVAKLEPSHSLAESEATEAVALLGPSHSVAKPEAAQAVTLQPTHTVAQTEVAQAVTKTEPTHSLAHSQAARAVAKVELSHSVSKSQTSQVVAELKPLGEVLPVVKQVDDRQNEMETSKMRQVADSETETETAKMTDGLISEQADKSSSRGSRCRCCSVQ